jgi:hypothetical protein
VIGLPIVVCHFPRGTGKWNKIEHRLFSFISHNWRGKPLIDYATIINPITSTTTSTGLKAYARPQGKWIDAQAEVNFTSQWSTGYGERRGVSNSVYGKPAPGTEPSRSSYDFQFAAFGGFDELGAFDCAAGFTAFAAVESSTVECRIDAARGVRHASLERCFRGAYIGLFTQERVAGNSPSRGFTSD